MNNSTDDYGGEAQEAMEVKVKTIKFRDSKRRTWLQEVMIHRDQTNISDRTNDD